MGFNFIFISPHFPPNWYQFAKALKNLPVQVNVLAIGDTPYENLSPELKKYLTEYYKLDSLENYNLVLRAVAFFTHRYGKIDRIESHNEHWLAKDARLRTDFNVDGLKTIDMPTIKRKSLMKEVFRAAGASVVPGKTIESFEEMLDFGSQHGYPLVVKPDIGVGANDTYRVNGPDDRPPISNWSGFFVEKYLYGTIESFDGLIDAEGNPMFYTSHVFSDGIMEVALENNHCNYYNQISIPKDLETIGLKCVELFNVRERFFHFEFFRTHPNGEIFGLEVNIRPPGGYTMDMFNYAHDVNLYQIWAEMLTGQLDASSMRPIPRPYHLIYLSRRRTIPYAHSHEELVNRYSARLALEQPVHPGLNLLGNHLYIFRTKGSIDEVFEFIDFAWERPDGRPLTQRNRGPFYPRPATATTDDEKKKEIVTE